MTHIPHKKTKEQIQKEKRELISKSLIRFVGLMFVVGGVFKELYHIISKTIEPLWGSIFSIKIHTSSVLILVGVLIFALSFKAVMEYMKKLNFFKKK